MIKNIPDHILAKSICEACGENPNHVGDAGGNEFRWQDYLDVVSKFRSSLDSQLKSAKIKLPHGPGLKENEISKLINSVRDEVSVIANGHQSLRSRILTGVITSLEKQNLRVDKK